jgi:hypothetical protein
MTIAHGFLAKSAQVGGVSLNGMTTFSNAAATATQVNTRSDGELFEQRTVIIPDNEVVEAQTRDIAAAVAVGATGALSLVADKMTGGITLAGTVTVAAASSTVTSVSRGTDIDGNAVLNITARVNSANGTSSGVTVTST